MPNLPNKSSDKLRHRFTAGPRAGLTKWSMKGLNTFGTLVKVIIEDEMPLKLN